MMKPHMGKDLNKPAIQQTKRACWVSLLDAPEYDGIVIRE